MLKIDLVNIKCRGVGAEKSSRGAHTIKFREDPLLQRQILINSFNHLQIIDQQIFTQNLISHDHELHIMHVDVHMRDGSRILQRGGVRCLLSYI